MEVSKSHAAIQSSINLENASGEYLSFSLGDENYALGILNVQEIRGYDCVTKIVNTPEYIKGVVNLRGKIVPIVDLRTMFSLPQTDYDEMTVVIILNLNGRDVGIVVDTVSDVINLNPSHINHVPTLVSTIDTKHLVGIANVDDQMIILVDIEKLMAPEALSFFDTPTIN